MLQYFAFGLHRIILGLPKDALQWQPDSEANNIAVSVWHIGRSLDVLQAKLSRTKQFSINVWGASKILIPRIFDVYPVHREVFTCWYPMSMLEGWLRSWAELGVPVSAPLRDVFADVVSRYAEPHRFYHTGQHLAECFERWSDLRAQAKHPAEVEVALWFHDAVYDTHSDLNEARSADLAMHAAQSLGIDAVPAQRIHDLIMSTRHATLPVGQDARLLVDTDLAILGAETARFVEYEHQVRQEYAWVPENVFRERRANVLRGFLERSYIFSTELFREYYERRARANIRQSLDTLSLG